MWDVGCEEEVCVLQCPYCAANKQQSLANMLCSISHLTPPPMHVCVSHTGHSVRPLAHARHH